MTHSLRWLYLIVLAVTMLLVACGTVAETPAPTEAPDASIAFAGSYLLAVSDADTVAQAYVTDDVGPAIEETDTLSILSLPEVTAQSAVTQIEVSNSVWGPPSPMDVTPDGRYAVVLEIKRQRDADTRSFENDLNYTTAIAVVDLQDPQAPRVIQQSDTGGFAAHSLDISPTGDFVAVANWQGPIPDNPDIPPQQISLLPLRDGQLGAPQLFPITNPTGVFVSPNQIAWHPSGDYLALSIGPRNTVVFYQVTRNADDTVELTPWGDPVTVGQFPFTAAWTPDGRFFITADMQWDLEQNITDVTAPTGTLSTVHFDVDETDGITHEVTITSDVGINPEGLAISPDGSKVVTVNLQRSHLPVDEGEQSPTASSITLLTLDSETGELTKVNEYEFEGVLPEGVVFDRTGEHLAVAIFDFNGVKNGQGALQFWRVASGDQPTLEAIPFEIPLVRGAHALVLIP